MSGIKPLNLLEKGAEIALPFLGPAGAVGAAALHGYDAYSSNNDYQHLLNKGPGDPMSTITPAEQMAYKGASDSNISQLSDRRYGQVVGDMGSRGLLGSGVAVNEFTALSNWQDNQRAQAEADMYKMGAQRAMSLWDQQLSGYGAIAKSDSNALAISLGTAGAKSMAGGGLFGGGGGMTDTTNSPFAPGKEVTTNDPNWSGNMSGPAFGGGSGSGNLGGGSGAWSPQSGGYSPPPVDHAAFKEFSTKYGGL
jgi:hypothetical protein